MLPTTNQPLTLICGLRAVGGLYIVTRGMKERVKQLGMAPFVLDPPLCVYDLGDWGLSAQGVGFWTDPRTGITHLTRYYGENNYIDPTDPIEETINVLGSSLIPATVDKEKLKMLIPQQSYIHIFHKTGYYTNEDAVIELKKQRETISHIPDCFLKNNTPMRDSHVHAESPDMCSALWWQAGTTNPNKKATERKYLRHVENLYYEIAAKPDNLNLMPQIAMIARFPLDEFHVPVGDGSHGQEEVAETIGMLEKLQTKLPFRITES